MFRNKFWRGVIAPPAPKSDGPVIGKSDNHFPIDKDLERMICKKKLKPETVIEGIHSNKPNQVFLWKNLI